MSQFIVRNLEDDVHEQLRKLARSQGLSLEEMVREILRSAVLKPTKPSIGLGSRIAARFSGKGIEGEIAELRGQQILPPDFAMS